MRNSTPAESDAVRLSTVLHSFSDIIHLNPELGNDDVLVSDIELYDAMDPLTRWKNRIVLAVGISTASEVLSSFLSKMVLAGASAVVIKAHGTPLTEVVTVAKDSRLPLLVVRDDEDWPRLSTMLRTTIQSAESRTIPGVRLGDIYALANAIASLVHGATSIVDPTGKILGYSTLLDQPIDELRRATTLALQETTPPAFDPDFAQVYASPEAIRIAGADGELDRCAIAIRADGELLGTIWIIDADSEPRVEILSVLNSLAPQAGLHLLHARSGADFGERRNADLMRALLEESPQSSFAAEQLGITSQRGFAVAAFRFSRPDLGSLEAVRELYRLLNLVTITLNLHYSIGLGAIINASVYALIPSDKHDSRSSHRNITGEIIKAAGAVSSHPVIAALGSPSSEVHSLAESRIEADQVMELIVAGGESSHSTGVGLVEDFRAEIGIKKIGEFLQALKPHEFDDVERLRKYDEDHNSDYVATLKNYLDLNGNIADLASALNIHNNTARYRIEKLITEFGFDLHNPPQRLWLWIRLSANTQAVDIAGNKPSS